MKKLIFLLLPFLFLITSVLAQCVTPYENIEINTSTTFCKGTYYLNDSDTNGVINITGDNLILDCNSSEFIGSNIVNSVGIVIVDRANVTIKNCILRDYFVGIYVKGDNIHINNSTILGNQTQYSLGIMLENSDATIEDTYVSNFYELISLRNASLTCRNSELVGFGTEGSTGWGIHNSNYASIIGYNCVAKNTYWSFLEHSNNTYMSNLTFQDNAFRDIFANEEVHNLTIENSRFEGELSDFHIAIGEDCSQIIIRNNVISGGQGFYIPTSHDVRIENNQVQGDGNSVISDSYNIFIINNTINRTYEGTGGTLYFYLDVKNVTMRNNKIYNRIGYGVVPYLTSCSNYDTLDIDTSNTVNDEPLYYLLNYLGYFNNSTSEVIIANSKGFRLEGDYQTVMVECSKGNVSANVMEFPIGGSVLEVRDSTVAEEFFNLLLPSNISVYDSSLNNVMIMLGAVNLTLINTTFNTTSVSDPNSHLYVGWWLNLTIKPVSASVKITNQLDQIEFQGTVSKAKIPLTQYEKYYGGSNEVIVNYTPHTVSARALGYVPKEVSITMDDNKDLVIDLGVYRYSLVNPIFSIIVTLGITSLVGAWLYYTIKGIPIPKNLSDIVKIYFIFIAVTIVIILLSVLFQYL